MTQVTLVVDAFAADSVALPVGFAVRSARETDADRLGQLYFDCQVPGADLADSAEAVGEVRAFFRGDFGEFWPAGSGVIESGGRLIAALLAVHRAPWDDTPDCPFITDLFTEPAHRQHGLARALVIRCLTEASATSRPKVALRADSDNTRAIRLYESLGFRRHG